MKQERRRGHVHRNHDFCTGFDVSNADLPGRQSGQGVGMYVFALLITAGGFFRRLFCPGASEKLPGIFRSEEPERTDPSGHTEPTINKKKEG